MTKPKGLLLCALLLCGGLLLRVSGHDLFLKFDSYFLPPNSRAAVRLFNGTFRTSENAVARDRMVDVSVIQPSGERAHPPSGDWADQGATAVLTLQTGAAGTYVAGLYTKPREITLPAPKFNSYLAQDGLPDTLAARRRNRELNEPGRERYSKHVKAIFQVGDTRTANFQTALGYPVEIIPQQNPYALKVGDTLELLCVKEGQPLAHQFVLAGREVQRRLIAAPGLRTDASGIARLKLSGAGKWFVKFIHMTKLNEPELDYESKWASLTFEVRN